MLKAGRRSSCEETAPESEGPCQEVGRRNEEYMAACGLLADDIWFVFNGDGKCLKEMERPWTGRKGKCSPVECKVHECCSKEKGHAHCGLCDEFPCQTYAKAELPCLVSNCQDERREKALNRLHRYGNKARRSKDWYDDYEFFGTSIII